MLQFCPTCANLLAIEEGEKCLKFACRTCPYEFNILRKITSRLYPRLKISHDPAAAVRHAVACLNAGKVIAVPTDTVYGLATSAQCPHAIRRLYEIKARDENKPLAICLSEANDVHHWAKTAHLPENLLNTLLPGPVTLVLKRKNELNNNLNPGNSKVGIRVPDDFFIQNVAKQFGGPIALTSANVSLQPSSINVEEFRPLWPLLEAIFDGGTLVGSRQGSTVVDLSLSGQYHILRDGSALDETEETLKRFHVVPIKNL